MKNRLVVVPVFGREAAVAVVTEGISCETGFQTKMTVYRIETNNQKFTVKTPALKSTLLVLSDDHTTGCYLSTAGVTLHTYKCYNALEGVKNNTR